MLTDDEPEYQNPEDFIWDTYLKASKNEDEARPKNWEGSTTGILTFTGLFAATVAAFIIESYKQLSVDSSEQTVQLLSQLLVATANASSGLPVVVATPEPFFTPTTAVVTNALWFSSLLISLICALLATLVQEWSRAYVQDINRRTVLHETMRERAFNHIFIRMGVNRYGMDQFVSWIVALVHLAVFLFACGLLVFLFPIHDVVAGIATVMLGSFMVVYCVASLLPLLERSCPYRTPITYLMGSVYWSALQSRFLRPMLRRFDKPDDRDWRTFPNIVARRYADSDDKFLSTARSSFLWEHMYPNVSGESDDNFFGGLSDVIDLHPERDALLRMLCIDDGFIRRLCGYLDQAYHAHRNNPSVWTPIALEVFRLISYLSRQIFAPEIEYNDSDSHPEVATSRWILHLIGIVSSMAEAEGHFQLPARLCLAYVRRSLIELCLKAPQTMQPLRDHEISDFFTMTHYLSYRLSGRHPSSILLLLVGGSYSDRHWSRMRTSALLPLHDGDCCRNWSKSVRDPEGRAHIAACNALSLVALVLNSTHDQHKNAKYPIKTALYDVREQLVDQFPASEVDMSKSKMPPGPSPDFVNILRTAGLKEWLEPGSTFVTDPHSDSPHHDFLTISYSGHLCVTILRILADRVDFAAYRLQQRPALPSKRTPSSPLSASAPIDDAPGRLLDSGFNVSSAETTLQPERGAGIFIVTDTETLYGGAYDIFSTYDQDVDAILSGDVSNCTTTYTGELRRARNGNAPSALNALLTQPQHSRNHIDDQTIQVLDNDVLSRSTSSARAGEDKEEAHPPDAPVLKTVVMDDNRALIQVNPEKINQTLGETEHRDARSEWAEDSGTS